MLGVYFLPEIVLLLLINICHCIKTTHQKTTKYTLMSCQSKVLWSKMEKIAERAQQEESIETKAFPVA